MMLRDKLRSQRDAIYERQAVIIMVLLGFNIVFFLFMVWGVGGETLIGLNDILGCISGVCAGRSLFLESRYYVYCRGCLGENNGLIRKFIQESVVFWVFLGIFYMVSVGFVLYRNCRL